MKSEQAINIVEELGNNIPKGQKAIFSAIVEDNKKMEQRMSALEKTVSEVKNDVRDIKNDLKDVSRKIEKVINEKQSLWKFLGLLVKETRFWVWLIIVTLLIFGITSTDLSKFLKFDI